MGTLEISSWRKALEEERRLKDHFFKTRPHSSIPFEDRNKFMGLDYYPLDPKYRFELELHEHDEKKIVKLMYTKGEVKESIRWGEFRFKIDDKECVLQAYVEDPEEEILFVPFGDLTNGKETYGAGRYPDPRTEVDRTKEGKWVLGFNKAYNPWCGYSEKYTCPFVSPENWLKVSIRAGEENYSLKK